MKFKKKYFNNVKNETESKSFCHKCKSYFSNKFSKGDSKILLIKIEDVIDKESKLRKVGPGNASQFVAGVIASCLLEPYQA